MKSKKTNAKRQVVSHTVQPVVRGSDIPVNDQYSYMAWLAVACIGDLVKKAEKDKAEATANLSEMKKYHKWMRGIATRCEHGKETDNDRKAVRAASRDMFK